MLDHDGPPRIDPAAARITTRPALRKGFVAQAPGDGAPADAEAKDDPVPRPALAMECPHLLVLSLAPLVARVSQEPSSFLRLGGREKKIAVPAHGLTAGLIDRAKVLGMAGEYHFQHLGQGLQQMKKIGDLHRHTRSPARAFGLNARAVAGDPPGTR